MISPEDAFEQLFSFIYHHPKQCEAISDKIRIKNNNGVREIISEKVHVTQLSYNNILHYIKGNDSELILLHNIISLYAWFVPQK